MKKIIEKFITIEKKIANQKGRFRLFALFEREDAQDKWDVIISAQWFEKNKKETLKFIVDSIKEELTSDEMLIISRIVLLEPKNPLVININNSIQREHSSNEIIDCTFDGIFIKHAYIVTSKNSHSKALKPA